MHMKKQHWEGLDWVINPPIVPRIAFHTKLSLKKGIIIKEKKVFNQILALKKYCKYVHKYQVVMILVIFTCLFACIHCHSLMGTVIFFWIDFRDFKHSVNNSLSCILTYFLSLLLASYFHVIICKFMQGN